MRRHLKALLHGDAVSWTVRLRSALRAHRALWTRSNHQRSPTTGLFPFTADEVADIL